MPSPNTPTLPRPEVIAFDCYRTLLENDPADWEVMFGRITAEQRLGVSAAALWAAWKTYEVKFRSDRLAATPEGRPPPFRTYEQAWTECFVTAFEDLSVRADATSAARRCVEHLAKRPPFRETGSVLRTLAGRCRLAVLSNADDAFLGPATAQLDARFEVVVSSESARTYKPAPAIFASLVGRLGVAPGRIWFIGDHLNEDVRGSQDAGMTAIWVNRPASQGYYAGQVGISAGAVPKPDAEIADLNGLLSLFENAAGAARR